MHKPKNNNGRSETRAEKSMKCYEECGIELRDLVV
jgi:hypothetical protein